MKELKGTNDLTDDSSSIKIFLQIPERIFRNIRILEHAIFKFDQIVSKFRTPAVTISTPCYEGISKTEKGNGGGKSVRNERLDSNDHERKRRGGNATKC